MSQDFAKAAALEAEYADLEAKLSDPGTHANQAEARRIGKRHAELKPVVAKYREWRQFGEDEQAAREMGAEDASFLAEADDLARDAASLVANASGAPVPAAKSLLDEAARRHARALATWAAANTPA